MTNSVQFMQWCYDGKEELVCQHIKEFDLDAQLNSGESALYLAVTRGEINIVKLLLEQGAKPNQQVMRGVTTILHLAAFKASLDIVESLLKKQANINDQDINGNTPLHEAAANGRSEITHLLLKYGADINILNNQGDSPLHAVVRKMYLSSSGYEGEHNYRRTLQYLVCICDNPLVKDSNQQTILDIAIKVGVQTDVTKVYNKAMAFKDLMSVSKKPILFNFNLESKSQNQPSATKNMIATPFSKGPLCVPK